MARVSPRSHTARAVTRPAQSHGPHSHMAQSKGKPAQVIIGEKVKLTSGLFSKFAKTTKTQLVSGAPVAANSCVVMKEPERCHQREKQKTISLSEAESHSHLDEDGDLDVARRPAETAQDRETTHPVILSRAEGTISDEEEEEEEEEQGGVMDIIKIEHTMATPLEDVGKQIWRGAFLLSDFILSNPDTFRGATVLELGAGTGLASIVASRVSKTIYCTDEHHVKVRQLDWTTDDFFTDADCEFGWMEDEIADLHDNTTLIVAADVCYDDDLTDALFRTLYRICSNLRHSSTIYISLEKRMNFTLRHMDVSCEAYDHFRRCLEQLTELREEEPRFTLSPVSCSFPQFFQYERVDQLELWKVSACPFQTVSSSSSKQNQDENQS
ncbi:Methyltransferase-like protein 22 [Bagarius yarrelli]|uniref:Methyltransferase-like protein 22 n=1 Tax=Bagarius yarrelli TaxID=175774 RepID=A0A556VVQ0_BAGYA|nr:Methyltransferase-like protein 22 [Bagarius yarrelli]